MTTIETLNIPNFLSPNILEEAQLSADAASGQTALTVLNSDGISDHHYISINPGFENGEIRQISGSPTATGLTVASNLSLAHKARERVIRLFANQIRIYRAVNVDGTPPADSAFSILGSATNIKADQTYTRITDSAGGSDYFYKFTYYNSYDSSETDISLSEPIRGGGWGHYVTIEDIRDEAGVLDARNPNDTMVSLRRDAAESEVKSRLASAGYQMPLQTTSGVSYVPYIVAHITRILAAGLLLQKNFGITKPGSSKNGADKIDQARQLLAEIQLNDVVLLDSNDQPLQKSVLVSGWPDDTTKTVKPGDRVATLGPVVTMNKVF